MDTFAVYTEEIVKTTEITTEKMCKKSKPWFFIHLLDCLNKRKHEHMLKYVINSNNEEFEVTFIDKKSKLWKKKDISLFEDSDKYLEDIHDKERSPYSDDCKGRFRARMQKCFGKYVKFINEEKDKEFKCKRVAKYKILCIPHCYTVGATNKNKGKIKRKPCRNETKKKNNMSSNVSMPQELKNKIIPSYGLEKNKSDSHYLCLLTFPQLATHDVAVPSIDLNVQNMGMKTVIGNSDDYTNLVTLGVSAPSVDLNVQNVGMETVIGNLDDYTNLVTLGVSAPSIDLNVQNEGMEIVTGNLDDYTNLVTHDVSAPSVDLNVQNVGMETVIGNLDDYTNLVTLDVSAPSIDLNAQNGGMETVIGNLDDYTNLITSDVSTPSVDLNVQNVRMETVIGNLDDYTNICKKSSISSDSNSDSESSLRKFKKDVICKKSSISSDSSSDSESSLGKFKKDILVTLDVSAPSIDLNVQNVGMETVIGNPDDYINICKKSSISSDSNSDSESSLRKFKKDVICKKSSISSDSSSDSESSLRKFKKDVDILGEFDEWLCNYRPIC